MTNFELNYFSKRLKNYDISLSHGPFLERPTGPLRALSHFLWASLETSVEFISLKEVDYFFRDDPRSQWLDANLLLDLYEKAKIEVLNTLKHPSFKSFSELSLPHKVALIRLSLTEKGFDPSMLYFVGKDFLILNKALSTLDQVSLEAISPLFLEYQLKFHEAHDD